jgi:flagellar biogenesis protein FliO
LWQYFIYVVVVVGILFLAYYISKLVANNGTMAGKGKNITVIERIAVSKDCSVVLLKAAGKLLVVGVTPHSMQTLAELNEQEAEEITAQPRAESFSEVFKRSVDVSLPEGKFKDALAHFMNRKGGGGDDET